MDRKYLINEDTLNRIAQAIRTQENSDGTIATTDFAKRIEAIEPTIEDYMRISDGMSYPQPLNESNYSEKEVDKCTRLIDFYKGLEV